ncbi:MAG: hypothetical protein IJS45_07220 [Clostridia bacterium]|nr:hypothetical protein [Clostridia bacterium]
MKKIISLICILVLAVPELASCGGNEEVDTTVYSETFVPVDANSATALRYISGSVEKDINTKVNIDKAVSAYNSVTETEKYASGEKEEWSFIIISDSESGNTVYKLSGVGENKINVSVSSPESEPSRYLVKNAELYNFLGSEVLTVKEISVSAKVVISLGEGTPDGEGAAREAEVLLGEATVTVTGDEITPPTAADAIIAALESNEITSDYKVSKNAGTVISINGYEYKVEDGDLGVDILRWKYSVDGEAVPGEDLNSFVLTDGATITVIFTYQHIDKNG